LPKALTNQKFNVYIKEVAKLAKIKDLTHKAITKGGTNVSKQFEKHELVTSHTARRSFATNLYKSGFPAISIMKITGHKTETAFLKYIKVTPEEHAKLLYMHWIKQDQHLQVV
jgi:integrase